MKQIYLLLLFASTFAYAGAREIDESKAREIAQAFFRKKGCKVQSPRLIHDSNGIRAIRKYNCENGIARQPSFYVFSREDNPESKGFVIVSADDEVRPVIGWSDNAVYDADQVPVQLEAFLQEYDHLLSEVRSGNAKTAETRGGAAVAPLISTKWDQGAPFNRYTPSYSSGNAPAGCVATAMAQVMKYYNYPANGHGTIGGWYFAPEDIDLSESVYDWNNMPDIYTSGQYSENEAAAVGRLTYDAGRAVETKYGQYESAAHDTHIPGAMYKYFNYDGAITYKKRDYYDSQAWIGMIRESLLRGEPLIYGGTDGQDGHEFVCDGIDGDDYLHINWGWGGYCDGYFDMNAFIPEGTGTGGGRGDYYQHHGIIVNIRPGNPDEDHSDFIRPPMVLEMEWTGSHPDNPWMKDNILATRLYNTSNSDRNAESIGIIIDLYDGNKNLIKENLATTNYRYFLKSNHISWSHNYIDLSSVPNGDYYVSLRYTTDKDRPYGYPSKYDYVADFDFAGEEFIPLKVKDGKVVIEEESDEDAYGEWLTIEKAEQEGDIYELVASPAVNVTIRNNNSSMTGSIRMTAYCVAETDFSGTVDLTELEPCGSVNLSGIYGSARHTVRFMLDKITWLSPGKYHLVFAVDGNTVKSESDCRIVVLPTPTDNPMLMLSRLSTSLPTQDNGPANYMKLSWTYSSPDDWAHWYVGDVPLQLWGCNEATPKEEFLMYEIENSDLQHSPGKIRTINVSCYPELKWRAPGQYRMWLKYKVDGEWKVIPGEYNLCTFQVTDYEPSWEYLELAAPAEINGGNPVETGKEFEVKLKFRSPTGIRLSEENTYFIISPSPDNYRTIFAADGHPVMDKWELAAGESCEVTMKFCLDEQWADIYGYDLKSIIGKKLLVNPYICFIDNDGEWQATIKYNEHIPSLYFISTESSGITEIVRNDTAGIDYTRPYEVYNINGVCIGRTTDSLSSGIYIIRQGRNVSKFIAH